MDFWYISIRLNGLYKTINIYIYKQWAPPCVDFTYRILGLGGFASRLPKESCVRQEEKSEIIEKFSHFGAAPS